MISEHQLAGEIVSIGSLEQSLIQNMFSLMQSNYDNVTREHFEMDLSEKEATILLRDKESGDLKGFSTLVVLDALVDGIQNRALFSGDTIIDKDYWGSTELPKQGLKYVFQRKAEMPNIPFYWFLISKGYKTYRFLPIFFEDFYPNVDGSHDPNYKKVLDAFASSKFQSNYDPKKGLIISNRDMYQLKEGVADIDNKRIKDRHVRYFTEMNPNWAKGDELACITKIDLKNLRKRTYMLLSENIMEKH